MPKTRKQKQDDLQALTDNLAQAKGVVFVGYHGLTVPETEILRRQSRKENISFTVIKKTLLSKALSAAGLAVAVNQIGAGGLAAAFGRSDEAAPAKLLHGFAKDHEALKIYGGILENKFIDAGMVLSLAKLPSKMELYGKLVGSINAPVSGLVNALAGTMRGLVTVLNGIKEAKA